MTLRILLCTAHFGDGHQRVADALRVEYESLGCTVEEIDCLRDAHPKFSQWSEYVFNALTRYAPGLYGWSHEWTRNLANDSWFWRALSRGPRVAAQAAVERFQPDIVLQLFPEQTLVGMQASQIVTGVVLTDFSLHSRWFCPGADVYYLPHDSFASAARRFVRRRSEATFAPLGIPIRRQFAFQGVANGADYNGSPTAPLVPIRENNRRHVVVATGGRGVFPDLEQVLELLLQGHPGLPIQVLCGRNEAMLQRLRVFAQRSSAGARVFPIAFVENVADYLTQAVYAVVKPGGVTVAECLACGCPMLFFQPGAGQERDNARFVERFGAGRIAPNLQSFAAAVAAFSDPLYLEQASFMAASLAHAQAARCVAEDSMNRALAKRR